MTKIDRTKIVKAAVGSARLEGYKGSFKVTNERKATDSQTETKSKTTSKR